MVLSFVSLFGINYKVESRAYHQLAELLSRPDSLHRYQLDSNKTSQKNTIRVEVFHEKYEILSVRWLVALSVITVIIGLVIGLLIYQAEERKSNAGLAPPLLLYLGCPILMDLFFYEDMMGIILVSFIYLALFFVIRGIQEFNPHSEPGFASSSESNFKMIFQVYQRYILISLAVVGFVAATFMATASSMLKDVYETTQESAADIYRALHFPYLQGMYAFAAIGCISFVAGFTRECHLKLHELIRMNSFRTDARRINFE